MHHDDLTGESAAAPLLIGAGVVLQSVGFTITLLAALAALGLDRSGYPVISELGHPVWILGGAALGALGGIVCAYGCWRLASAYRAVLLERDAPAGVSGSRRRA